KKFRKQQIKRTRSSELQARQSLFQSDRQHRDALAAFAASDCVCSTKFSPIDGSLCINSDFVRTFAGAASELQCAILCRLRPQCQAFSLSDGPCQLFEFNKCSKSVRDCGCSRRGRVFVRQQPGLPAGLLCPPGYGDDLCGVKYKVVSGSWDDIKSTCESESGLVIMADVTSTEELAQVNQIRSLHTGSSPMWLGGFQAPGSIEPSGGWHWLSCNISMDSSLWHPNEPNDKGGQDKLAAMNGRDGLTDLTSASFGLCECASPFN
uniref:C-type lectin domain-containing protein n=2 Tax=Macrostomum lignano TaxID=282301 RepID=A0A1I8HTM9_9PLAT